MRPGQNKRMRGRPNNRKGPNPLTRSYESNGPDVKIRGTAHHIGEKYLQLARDAQSAGDPVMAESYLQHAEHYFRLIAAAQLAQQQAATGYQRTNADNEIDETDEDEDDFGGVPDRFASPLERFPSAQPQIATGHHASAQPYTAERSFYGSNGERQPYERNERERHERGPRQDNRQDNRQEHRQEARQERSFQDRSFQERSFQERRERHNDERNAGEDRPQREQTNRGGRGGRNQRDYYGDNARNERFAQREEAVPTEVTDGQGTLPAFITAPVRLQPEHRQPEHRQVESRQPERGLDQAMDTLPGLASSPADSSEEVTGFHLRPRRRRRTKAEMAAERGYASDKANAPDPVSD